MAITGYDVILLGASTGGPRAIETVLTGLPDNLGVPVLVVQHMPRGFTKSFAERLDRLCNLKVMEVKDGVKIENNVVYIAQGGSHMIVDKNKRLKLTDDPPIWGVRPAVDKLMISGVSVYGKRTISVILTGMGKDGAKGIEETKKSGGKTIAQDKDTSVIYGMPKAAYETGKVDFVMPLDKISNKIISLVRGREDNL